MTALLEYLDLLLQDIGQKGSKEKGWEAGTTYGTKHKIVYITDF